jgi:hypothetical protein
MFIETTYYYSIQMNTRFHVLNISLNCIVRILVVDLHLQTKGFLDVYMGVKIIYNTIVSSFKQHNKTKTLTKHVLKKLVECFPMYIEMF